MAILEVKNLKKSFGQLSVLNDINFTLEKGEVLSIIGSSGGGKTTLLRSLNELETPDGGEIIIDGKTVFGKDDEGKYGFLSSVSSYMGLVFQQFNLFPQYSVIGNLTLAPRVAAQRDPDFKAKKKDLWQYSLLFICLLILERANVAKIIYPFGFALAFALVYLGKNGLIIGTIQ